MTNEKIDKFIENNNMTYLFLLLANLEADRISSLPYTIRKNIEGKVTSKALEHIAINNIPDYILKDIQKEDDLAEEE